jgi:hypothetical protein
MGQKTNYQDDENVGGKQRAASSHCHASDEIEIFFN